MPDLNLLNSLSVMKPKPSPFPLIRIGGDRDGAYLVPDDVSGITACFSPGVNNFKFFEDELALKYKIKCHLCDYSSDVEKFKTPLITGMQTFKKKWLDINENENNISLEDWVTELESNTNEDLMLQMDIEGAEYRNLIHCPEPILSRFRIIVLELHQLDMLNHIELFEEKLSPLLQKLDQLFICVHAHPNNCCGEFLLTDFGLNIPNIIELTFLRSDRFSNRDALIAPQLPHPLDIRANVPSNPPLFLNEKWLEDGIRSNESKVKMLEDQLKYYESRNNIDDLEENFKLANQSIATLHSICLSVAQKLYGHHYNSINLQDTYNITEGKSFFLSSSYGNYPKQGLIKTQIPFFFHTNFGVNQFITIDLGNLHEMMLLVIHNRSDICLERAKCLFYVIHDSIQFDLLSGLPVNITQEFLTIKQSKCITPLMGMRGKYISIFSPEYTALHFQSIAVFGKFAGRVI